MSTSANLGIEQLLAEAGFDFTAVERCPVVGCEVCDADDFRVAA
mgnify:FL=1